MNNLFFLLSGLILGVIIILFVNWLLRRDVKTITKEIFSQNELQKTQDIEALINRIKESFGELSLQALSRNTDEFLKLANETLSKQTQIGEKELEGKKKLIDQTLNEMKEHLHRVQNIVTDFEKDREKKFGELSNQLKVTAEQTGKLQETTSQLRSALSSTKARGQWGERMAEDVLRLAGFVEGVNYRKQKALETAKTIPDYTFFLPQDLKVNMDVKFPLDNYLRFLEEEKETDKSKYKNQFLRDVRNRIKEVTTREYINPSDKTVDYVIVFIPNDQVYAFINESDNTIIDDALRNKVVLCSPITLYAILAVIRQALDSFSLEKTAAEILSLLGVFNNQWIAFQKSLEKMGKKIDEAQKEYVTLTSTRRNQLERPLRKIEDLRKQKGISSKSSLAKDDKIPFTNSEEENNNFS
ncbi:DNA recombination protein RmuC [candidate division WOR-3 bacterium]|nr:DNA recombination protein RmuC [candidate division WOR-3 bacterium]